MITNGDVPRLQSAFTFQARRHAYSCGVSVEAFEAEMWLWLVEHQERTPNGRAWGEHSPFYVARYVSTMVSRRLEKQPFQMEYCDELIAPSIALDEPDNPISSLRGWLLTAQERYGFDLSHAIALLDENSQEPAPPIQRLISSLDERDQHAAACILSGASRRMAMAYGVPERRFNRVRTGIISALRTAC